MAQIVLNISVKKTRRRSHAEDISIIRRWWVRSVPADCGLAWRGVAASSSRDAMSRQMHIYRTPANDHVTIAHSNPRTDACSYQHPSVTD